MSGIITNPPPIPASDPIPKEVAAVLSSELLLPLLLLLPPPADLDAFHRTVVAPDELFDGIFLLMVLLPTSAVDLLTKE